MFYVDVRKRNKRILELFKKMEELAKDAPVKQGVLKELEESHGEHR